MPAILMNNDDNVATAISDIPPDEEVLVSSPDGETRYKIKAKNRIPCAHKLAVKTIESGNDVIKYGEVIGRAKQKIETGEHTHIHNVESKRIK